MTRARFRDVALAIDPVTGHIVSVPNATITLYEEDGTTPLAQTIYQSWTGGATYANPFTTNASGDILFYLLAPQIVTIAVSGVGLGTTTITKEPVDVATFEHLPWFNVLDYGAQGIGGDDTDAFLRCQDALLADIERYAGGIFYVPKGQYALNTTLSWGDNLHSIYMVGEGKANTLIYPAVRGDTWDGRPFVQFVGCANSGIREMCLNIGGNSVQETSPGSGIYELVGGGTSIQSLPDVMLLLDPGASVSGNSMDFMNMRIQGAAKYGGVFFRAVASSAFRDVDIYYERCMISGREGENNLATNAAWVFTVDNPLDIQPSDGVAGMPNNQAGRSMSHVLLDGCETHDMVNAGPDLSRGNTSGIILHGASEIRLDNNNISTSGLAYITIAPTASAASGHKTQGIILDNTTLYTEGASVPAAKYGVSIRNVYSVSAPVLTPERIELVNACRIGLADGEAAGAVFHGVAGSSYSHCRLDPWTDSSGGILDGKAIILDGTGGTIDWFDGDGGGYACDAGSSGAVTNARGMRRFGTITPTPTGRDALDIITTAEDLLVAQAASNFKRLAVGASGRVLAVVSGVVSWVQQLLPAGGDATAPTYSFDGDPNTGVYRSAADAVALAGGGAMVAQFNASQFLGKDGGSSVPGWSFIEDQDTGIRRSGSDQITFLTGGTDQISIDPNGALLLKAAPATPVANGGYREGLAKGAVKFAVNGTILSDYNVSSITDNGAGDWTVNWDRDFSSADYAVVATAQGAWAGTDATTWSAQVHDTGTAAGATHILVMRVSDGTLSDPTSVHVLAFGTQ